MYLIDWTEKHCGGIREGRKTRMDQVNYTSAVSRRKINVRKEEGDQWVNITPGFIREDRHVAITLGLVNVYMNDGIQIYHHNHHHPKVACRHGG